MRIQPGESDKQIIDFLVSRYGNFILMKPPFEPGTYAFWFDTICCLDPGRWHSHVDLIRARKSPPGEV